MSSAHDPDDYAADGIDKSDPHHEWWHRRASLRNPENEEEGWRCSLEVMRVCADLCPSLSPNMFGG